ncbi:MAG: hypothetical protein FWH00_04800 [Oscillospiraceae bacterium]|nr:hypothetical protein [Oscillospiraceae bacterium]
MPENTVPMSGSHGHFKEAVCIEAGRIFDSCSDKDCLEDLQVFFTKESQKIINESSLIKCKSAEVLDVYLTVESVPFNKGYYAVDMSFFFRISFAAYNSPLATPVNVRGCAFHSKKVILYGSEGNVRSFCSGEKSTPYDYLAHNNMPTACLKAVDPITLACRVVEKAPSYSESIGPIPSGILRAFEGGEFVLDSEEMLKVVLVTIGLFTITTLERSVQLMIPAYDHCVPEKECVQNITPEDPCEMFKHIKFPVKEFFPENFNDMSADAGDEL